MQNVDKNTFLSINLNAINKNYNIIKKKVGKRCIIAATVKADAYGLGADKVVPSLIKAGCEYFFVATTSEAVQLRKINKHISILILNGLVTDKIDIIKKFKLIPVINNLGQLKKIEDYQRNKRLKLDIALHFDTGMSRLGFDKKETKYLLENKLKLLKKSKIIIVMSHLACADNKNSKLNETQLKKYLKIKRNFPNSIHSLSNSAGVLLGRKYHFDMVRPGISLYGGHCIKNEKKIYNNVVSLKARLIQTRNIYKGDTIGYGATYLAKSNMKIGTLALGYADGFNRLLSNNSYVLYKNKKIRILGRVSMDLITINLTKIDKLNANEEFIIISEQYSINNIAKIIKTIPYEILTNLGKRYQRKYISK